jgi:hypothetical protein
LIFFQTETLLAELNFRPQVRHFVEFGELRLKHLPHCLMRFLSSGKRPAQSEQKLKPLAREVWQRGHGIFILFRRDSISIDFLKYSGNSKRIQI